MKVFFFSSSLSLLLAVSDAASDRNMIVMSAKKECDPNKSVFRMAGSNAKDQCGPNGHCVLNGHSSLGGFCMDNSSHGALPMDMPEARIELCYVCGEPEVDGTTYVVTKSWELVGSHMCLELDGLGKEGRIIASQCKIFQQMIEENDLCGCTEISPTGKAIFSEDTEPLSEVEESSAGGALGHSASDDLESYNLNDLSGSFTRTTVIACATASMIFSLLTFA